MFMNFLRSGFLQHRQSVWTIYGFLLFLLLALFPSCKREQPAPENAKIATSSGPKDELPIIPGGSHGPVKVIPAGQAVPVGFLGYKVSSAEFEGERASAKESLLLVELAVVNTGANEHALPPLKVVNETGVEFSAEASVPGGPVSLTEKLAPGATSKGMVAFKVPRDHSYKLKIQDGSPPETVLIELATNQSPKSTK